MQISETTRLITAARSAIDTLTPLNHDCGLHCGHACCKDGEDGLIVGMELYPGEEALYPGASWYKIYHRKSRTILVCNGSCRRESRPLACRVFPLTPYAENGKPTAVMDKRAAPLCPLYASGKKGLSSAFAKAVANIAELLWQDERIRAYIQSVSKDIDRLSRLTL